MTLNENVVMRCPKCGQRYDPNPAGREPITCDCGVGWIAEVTFSQSPEGVVANGDIEYEGMP